MRPIAILLIIVCLAAVGLTGWLYLTANITVEEVRCTAFAARDQEALFQQLKDQVAAGAFAGTPFSTGDIGGAEDCQFYEYTLRLRNDTFLPAEVIEIQVTPMNGDILQTADPEARDLAPRSVGEFSAVILTDIGMHNVRELTLTYYLWGLPFSTRLTYSP